jgi:uncharacterized protein (DUF433 family)
MAKVSTLDRPMYSYAEAAHFLDMPTGTLRWWLDGSRRGNKEYRPVIRPERTDAEDVTWGEFVEARLLRGYRKRMSLQKLRPLLQRMREQTGLQYPLAHYRPLVDPAKQKLLYDLQREVGVPPRLYLVDVSNAQLVLAPPILEFLDSVDFEGGTGPALRYWPAGRHSPIAIDPNVTFGVPQIRGVRTELVAESVAAGESEDEASAAWGLSLADVRAAIAWEHRKAA